MEYAGSSNNLFLNKSTYITLRWIGIFGQFITINVVAFVFKFEFNYIFSNSIVLLGALSNIFLFYYYKEGQIVNHIALYFLLIDILQLSLLIYLTGGILNPFAIFLIIPSVFASSNLHVKTSLALIFVTLSSIIVLTFFHEELPSPLNHYKISYYYYYSIPVGLIIALIFLNYFAISFGKESLLRKEALDKIQEVIAKEQELVSLGGQAAAAAHSLGTPLSTIKIISQELSKSIGNKKEIKKDIELLISQVNRCEEILKRLSVDPNIEDDFIDKDLCLADYLNRITKSFEEISEKKFVLNVEQDTNPFTIKKSIELMYGIRNFIGNANKFASNFIYISLVTDSENSEITIEDDGEGFSKDIINKIGEPYLKSLNIKNKSKSGLGLGIFIGKTLLEKNYAKLIFRNSITRNGAEVKIKWKNKDLRKLN